MNWLLLIPILLGVVLVAFAARITVKRLCRREYDYLPHRRRFFNLEGLDQASEGISLVGQPVVGDALVEYRREVGDEMIVWLQDYGTAVGATTVYGKFVFDNSHSPSRFSPYVPLEDLTRVRFKGGRFGVGG
jgi:hypothetical protein